MKKTLFGFAAAIGMAVSSACSADLVVEYDGLAGVSQSPVTGIGITGIDLTRGAGITNTAGINFNSRDFSAASLADAITFNEYLSFGFTVNAGFQMSMTDIMVELDRSTTGPTAVYLLFDANNNGFDVGDLLGTDTIAATSSLFTFNSGLPTNLDNSDGLNEFRFYFSGASSLGGTMDIEDDDIGGGSGSVGLQLNGNITVIPEPNSALVLVGLASMLLIRRRR